MTEQEFLQQARWLAEERKYKASWCYVIFRQRYGKWPGKLLREGDPQPATSEFLDWLTAYWTPQTGTGNEPKSDISPQGRPSGAPAAR